MLFIIVFMSLGYFTQYNLCYVSSIYTCGVHDFIFFTVEYFYWMKDIYNIFIIHLSDEGHLHYFFLLFILSKETNEHDYASICGDHMLLARILSLEKIYIHLDICKGMTYLGYRQDLILKNLSRNSTNGYATVQSTNNE